MKHLLYFLTACALVMLGSPLLAQLTFSPENPIPGETVNLTYDPTGTELENVQPLEVTAYLFAENEPQAFEVRMVPEGKVFSGKLKLLNDTKAVLFSIENEADGKSDHNEERGHKFLCHEANRTTPVAGAHAAKAFMYGSFGYLGGMERSQEKALNLLKTEFRMHPASADVNSYFGFYAVLAKRLQDEEALADIEKKWDQLTALKKPSESELAMAIELATGMGKDVQLDYLMAEYQRRFPKGNKVQEDFRRQFFETADLAGKVALFQDFHEKFRQVAGSAENTDAFAANIASAYGGQGDWENMEKYLAFITDPTRAAGVLNSVAWRQSGESLDGEAGEVAKGKSYSARSLELLKQAMENSANVHPAYLTEKQWKNNLEQMYAGHADTYALLAFKSGDAAEALAYQEIACTANHFADGEMNERYCAYLEKAQGAAPAEAKLSDLIAQGHSTSRMLEQHRRLFLENNTLETAYAKFLAELERSAMGKMKADLAEKMLDDAAPVFQLRNLQGEEVSLASLQGKVVVVDFWATWCGPCVASFPGMQQAVNKYADRQDVEFVFVNTWERVADKPKNAADFMASKGYTFHVLMDEENKMVTEYGVSGIPTKFIIDKQGKIRFKSVGFNGSDDALLKEISLMIEMADEGQNGMTGAP